MEFRVLGPLEVLDGGSPVDVGTPRQRALLGLLVMYAGDPVSYDRLAEDLWDGDPPDTARHTLQAYVHRLRGVLDDAAWRLETTASGYQLKTSSDEIDARRFERLADRGRRALVRGDPRTAAAVLADAIGLWRGSLLQGLDLAAIEAERTRLDALRLTAVEDRVEADLALGRDTELIAELEALLADDPFRERLWGQLMIACYRAGRQADALDTFRRARQVLADEIGVEPGRWLCRVQEQVLLQDPALDARDPVPVEVHHDLPAPRSTFIGRRRELTDLEGLLRTRRLVTVTGPPGVGKSRLAIELATRVAASWPHGVYLVPLAELEDAGLVPSAIATALGVPSAADEPVLDTVVAHVRMRRLLLVLDNVEHVLGAAEQLATLLDAGPGLTVLATSRQRLRLVGEQEYPLDPLPLAASGDPGDRPGGDAVALFVDRAAAADPGFTVTSPQDVATVGDVVARLDGLPLAIELAAARLRLFPLAELHRRVSSGLDLLTDGPVERPHRQRTLRSAIAWSDDLLSPSDRALLRRLAVFRGGITVEAAEAVGARPPVDDVVGSLSRLVDASLVGRPADTDPPRFGMLETIREYTLERLRGADDEHETRVRHAAFHAALVDEAAPHLTQAEQARWLQRLDADHPNLRAVLGWAITTGQGDLALEMTAGLWRYWQLRGHLAEGRQWLEDALAVGGATREVHARALLGLAGICYWQFDLDAAESAYQQARELATHLDDWWIELEALFGLVVTVACHRGDLQQARVLEQEFHALTSRHQDPMAVGLGLATSQMMRLLAGDLEGSRHYGQLCLAGTRQAGQRWYEAQTLRTLALTSLRQERYHQARDELGACVEIALELGDLPGLAMDLDRLGQVAAILGDPEHGCVLAGAAARLRGSVGATITPKAFRWEREPAPTTARRSLTDDEIEHALARGRTMTVEEAAAYALPV